MGADIDDAGQGQDERARFYDLVLPRKAAIRLIIEAPRPGVRPASTVEAGLICRLEARPVSAASIRDTGMVAGGNALPFGTASLDCILVPSALGIAAAPERGHILAEAHRTLRPGGVLLIEAANPFGLRALLGRFFRPGRSRPGAVRPLTLGAWRRRLTRAGFVDASAYALAERPNGSFAMVSLTAEAARAHYRHEFASPFDRTATPMTRIAWLLARVGLMRFLEPSFLIVARR